MTIHYDWNKISDEVIEFVTQKQLSRAEFIKEAHISFQQYEDLIEGRGVTEEVLRRIALVVHPDQDSNDHWVGQRREAPPLFEVPIEEPPEHLRSGAFVMHRRSFDHAKTIVTALVLIYPDAPTGRSRFLTVQRNCSPNGRTYTCDHRGFVWSAMRSSVTQLVGLDDDCLRLVTLMRPLSLFSDDKKRITVKGSLQAIAQKGETQLYPSITPVLLESIEFQGDVVKPIEILQLVKLIEEDSFMLPDIIGSFDRLDPEMKRIDECLTKIGNDVLPPLYSQRAGPGFVPRQYGALPFDEDDDNRQREPEPPKHH